MAQGTSSHRPAVVRLLRREGRRLIVSGVDMVDGTPILDIKPYLSNVPAEDLTRGWLEHERGQVPFDPIRG